MSLTMSAKSSSLAHRLQSGTHCHVVVDPPRLWLLSNVLQRRNFFAIAYSSPLATQPSIPPGSVNEYQLQLGRQRQVWLIPISDERVGVQVKLWKPSRTRAIPERFCHTWVLQKIRIRVFVLAGCPSRRPTNSVKALKEFQRASPTL